MLENRETSDLRQYTHTGRDHGQDDVSASTPCSSKPTWDLMRRGDAVELMIDGGADQAFKVRLSPGTALALSSALSYFATS